MNNLTRKLEKQFPLNTPTPEGKFTVTCIGFGEFKIIPNQHFDNYVFNFREITAWLRDTTKHPHGYYSASHCYKMNS